MKKGEIECRGVVKTFNPGRPNEFTALKGIDLVITEGEYVSIIGPSGSGKSTLLNQISCLDTPTEGEVYIEGVDISKLSGTGKSKLRREKLGFIFQQFNLIPSMSAFENIELPMRFGGKSRKERKKRVMGLLSLVGLEDKVKNKQSELSGGQQQRIAIARSLANDPKIILADEPTGNLDTNTGRIVMELLLKLNREDSKTLIVVTHDSRIAESADRVIRLQDGKVVDRITQ
ncbi:MAG: ABC transporter ATP-binding protein [Candidatus Altiarchaeota archaeon]|nr:ABC transporter ATP-binding protein [Candidatus Altiarchaeota archaeon]